MSTNLSDLNAQVKKADYSLLADLNAVLKKHGIDGYIHNFGVSTVPVEESTAEGVDPAKCSFCCWSAGPQLLGCGICCDF